MSRILKVALIAATITSILGLTGKPFAQALFPHTYAFSCTGRTGAGTWLSLVGDMQFSGATAAAGGAEFINGSITLFASFTASFTNGTANAKGTGGNGIPNGCFTGKGIFSGDTFGVLDGFFGCYNETTHGFDFTQTSSDLGVGTVLTCQAKEM